MAEPKEPETKRKVLSALLGMCGSFAFLLLFGCCFKILLLRAAQNKKPSNPGPVLFPPAGLGVSKTTHTKAAFHAKLLQNCRNGK